MGNSFRSMWFSLRQGSAVTLDDILEKIKSRSSYLLKPRETKGDIFYCGDIEQVVPCRDYIRSAIPADRGDGVRLFEYVKDQPASGGNDPYLMHGVRQSAYAESLDDFIKGSDIDASMLRSHADYCGYFSVVQLHEDGSLPFKISLETVTYDGNEHSPVSFLKVEDILSPEVLTDPERFGHGGYFLSVRNMILDDFRGDLSLT